MRSLWSAHKHPRTTMWQRFIQVILFIQQIFQYKLAFELQNVHFNPTKKKKSCASKAYFPRAEPKAADLILTQPQTLELSFLLFLSGSIDKVFCLHDGGEMDRPKEDIYAFLVFSVWPQLHSKTQKLMCLWYLSSKVIFFNREYRYIIF